DGVYTVWEKVRREAGRRALILKAGLTFFGVPHVGIESRGWRVERACTRLLRVDIVIWMMWTDVTEIVSDWERSSGAMLDACLHWFSNSMADGVLPATGTFSELTVRQGSNPLTDPWLSSDQMRIIHDGAEHDLVGKARAVATWPEAVQGLQGYPE